MQWVDRGTDRWSVAAAYQLFCSHGFRTASTESIGAAAGVSVQTVHFRFRTKNEVLRGIHEWTVLGDESRPPEVVTGTADINARIAPTLPIFATLARESAGQIYRESRRLRREGMEHVVSPLQEENALRVDINPRRATDVLDFLIGPEAYALLQLSARRLRKRPSWGAR